MKVEPKNDEEVTFAINYRETLEEVGMMAVAKQEEPSLDIITGSRILPHPKKQKTKHHAPGTTTGITTPGNSPAHRAAGNSFRPARFPCQAGQEPSRPLVGPQPSSSGSLSQPRDSAAKATSFTPEQNAALMLSFIEHFPRLRGGLHSQTSHAERQGLWEEIARRVNAVGSTQRTISQCQKRVSDIFRHIKRVLGTEAIKTGTYPPHLVQRLREYERSALPFIGPENVGGDYRDDSDASQPFRPGTQQSPPPPYAQSDEDDEDVTHVEDDTGPPPDPHQQEEVAEPLQRGLGEIQERPCPLLCGSGEFSQAASTEEGPPGAHFKPEDESPEVSHSVDVGGLGEPSVARQLLNLTQRLVGHCDRVIGSRMDAPRSNDLGQLLTLLHETISQNRQDREINQQRMASMYSLFQEQQQQRHNDMQRLIESVQQQTSAILGAYMLRVDHLCNMFSESLGQQYELGQAFLHTLGLQILPPAGQGPTTRSRPSWTRIRGRSGDAARVRGRSGEAARVRGRAGEVTRIRGRARGAVRGRGRPSAVARGSARANQTQ
uniref:Myb/SANT-like DNA-binding domain-containing protein n=2 Tax=Pyxicephalus adspersus TaxID=30357 RepID=A0AAV2ZUP6_PYXAD|nr:TPA: hypothetical protein GDO54_004810 [Pyxicephalus adspersus]